MLWFVVSKMTAGLLEMVNDSWLKFFSNFVMTLSMKKIYLALREYLNLALDFCVNVLGQYVS